MATKLEMDRQALEGVSDVEYIQGLKIGIVRAEWNGHITGALCDGAVEALRNLGYTDDSIAVYSVPGTVELTFAAQQLIRTGAVSAVIVIGCVVRGDTPHFDYVCQSVTQGITQLNATTNTPVIFGVLTVDNEQQALDRAGGALGNKGTECALAAIKMCQFILQIQK
ncbi:MAG: 6,7-dimethyl-8-ribityllumazine synthase [Muribaculaceae bacterium]|nr:6,7-dimethyl-8-ribityllumazine synthase [Muribaculaceae bacterium]